MGVFCIKYTCLNQIKLQRTLFFLQEELMTFPKTLRVTVVPKPGFINIRKKEDGDYEITGGPEGELIKICAQALKFTYRIVPSTDGWGSLVNGTLTGGVGMVFRNEADIGVSKFGVSPTRLPYVDFSYPYTLEDLTFAIQKPELKSSSGALIRPFTFNFWVAVVISVFIMSVLFSIFEEKKFSKALLQMFKILISQSTKINFKRIEVKLLVSAWIFGSLFLSYSYMAVLLSFMTIPAMEKVPENYEELASAVSSGTYKAATFKGALALTILKNSAKSDVRLIGKHIEENKHLIDPTGRNILEAIKNEKLAFISPTIVLKLFISNVEFHFSKDSLKSIPFGIIMSKTFCCKNEIDNFVHTLFASGMYQKQVNDEVYKVGIRLKSAESSSPSEAEPKPLSMTDVSGAFVLIMMGHTLASFVAVAEIAYFKMCDWKKVMN